MRNVLRSVIAAFGAAAVLVAGTPAQAALLDGSLPLAGFTKLKQNKANLGISTLINVTSTIVSGPGLGDYAPVPLLTNYGPHTINLVSLTGTTINNFASFSLSNATFGSFAATSGTIEQRTPSFLDILYLGIYTPGPGLPGFGPTPSSLRISLNQSGKSLSEGVTLNSPPVIPEPATVALMLIGAIGVAAARRRQNGTRGVSTTR